MEMVRLTIDGVQVKVPKGTTVLEAARSANIQIPTLCYLKGINEIGACRMCLVEVRAPETYKLHVFIRQRTGWRSEPPSCGTGSEEDKPGINSIQP